MRAKRNNPGSKWNMRFDLWGSHNGDCRSLPTYLGNPRRAVVKTHLEMARARRGSGAVRGTPFSARADSCAGKCPAVGAHFSNSPELSALTSNLGQFDFVAQATIDLLTSCILDGFATTLGHPCSSARCPQSLPRVEVANARARTGRGVPEQVLNL